MTSATLRPALFALRATLALLGLWLVLLATPRPANAQITTYPCGGEGETPCAADTEFFWSNGNLFCDRGLKATDFNVLPDISFNLSNTTDLNQADLTQVIQLINTDWPVLQNRLTNLDENDFLTRVCTGTDQNGQCWLIPPTSPTILPGKKFPGTSVCIPTGNLESCTIPIVGISGYKEPATGICIPTGELSSCTVTIPGFPGAPIPFIWLPDPNASGWQVPSDVVTFISQAETAVATLPGDLAVSLPSPPDPTGILDFQGLSNLDFSSFSSALTTLKNLPSDPFFTVFEDLGNDFAAPPGTCVNDTRRQAAATAVQSSWTYWALANQRELAKGEPLNWTTQVNAHNAYNSAADGYPLPNQEYSLTDQLQMGVRVLSLDVHWFNDRMRLCHGKSDHFGCAALDRFYDGGLKEIAAWLDANPEEVVIIDLEDYLEGQVSAFDHLVQTYLGSKVYRGVDLPAHLTKTTGGSNAKAKANGAEVLAARWPTLSEMRAMNKQVIILGNDQSAWTWYNDATAGGKAKSLALTSDGGLANCMLEEHDLSQPGDQFLSVYEARSLLDPFDFPGLLNRLMIPGLAQCNVSYAGLDLIQAKEKTSDNICNAEHARVLEDTGSSTLADLAFQHCKTANRRLTQFVWSWAPPDRGQNGDRAALSVGDGRWRSTSSGAHHYACAAPRGNDPESWEDPRGETWRVTEAAGPWDEGEQACMEEFGDENLYFAVPVNGWQNQRLLAAADSVGLASGDAVWLDYRRLSADTWLPGNESPFPVPARTIAGDFNGNGRTDLIDNWAAGAFNRVRMRESDEDHVFMQVLNQFHQGDQAHWEYHTPYAGDFNGDGRTDLLWNNWWKSTGVFYVALAQPDGTFDLATTAHAIPLSEYTDWIVHPADVDGDGTTDLLATSSASAPGQVRVGLSNGDGTFTFGDEQIHFSVLNEGQDEFTQYEALVGDVTGDGRADVVWNGRPGVVNRSYVGVGQADGSFAFGNLQEHPVTTHDWAPYAPMLADVDGDGADDLVWNQRSSNTLYVALAAGDGTFDLTAPAHVHPGSPQWSGFELHVGDLDGDGRADLVWNRRTATENVWYLGVGQPDGTFMLSAPVQQHDEEIDWSAYTLFLADVDGGGRDALVWHDPAGTGTTYVWTAPDALLPVELTALSATVDRDAVMIQWQTASETNNAGFEVQTTNSLETGAWKEVAFVEGAGTTTEVQRYTYRAEALAPATWRFRLKQMDLDGSFSYSSEVEVQVEARRELALASPYPNPFNPQTQLSFTVPRTMQARVNVYDALGRQVATLFDAQAEAGRPYRLTFAGGNLSSGLYLVRLETEAGVRTQQVVLVK